MHSEKIDVCVIGGGVVGLSVASQLLELLEQPLRITVVAEGFLEETTSCGSGGLWEPYQVGGTPEELILKWGQYSYDYFLSLHSSPDCAAAGVQMITSYTLFEDKELPVSLPYWRSIPTEFRVLDGEELRRMQIPSKYVQGYAFNTVAVEQKYYLRYLMEKLTAGGVVFDKRRVGSITDVEGVGTFKIIINCTGLGAATMIPPDLELYPVKGQVLRARAPWIKSNWNFGRHYIIPNVDTVVLGGTADEGVYDTDIKDADTTDILDGVCSLFPSLRNAPIEKVWAGIRPCRRGGIFLDACTDHRGVIIANLYGHGGCGVTLAMGCAYDLIVSKIIPLL